MVAQLALGNNLSQCFCKELIHVYDYRSREDVCAVSFIYNENGISGFNKRGNRCNFFAALACFCILHPYVLKSLLKEI